MNPNASRKEKKELASTKKAVKTALNWILTIVCVVMVVFALVVAIFTIVRSTNADNLTKFGKKVYMNVASNSMEPTFNQNDVIIADHYEGDGKDLKVGMVITFHARINGYESYNTHRIVCIIKDANGNVTGIKTRGDNQEGSWKDCAVYDNTYDGPAAGPDGSWDPGTLSLKTFDGKNMIVATWGKVDDNGNFTPGKRLKGVGSFANWIQDPEEYKIRFFCVVVLPLIILFILYAFMLVRAILAAKLDSNRKRAQQPVTVDSLTEEEKKRLAMEYLASMQREALDGQGDAPAEGNADDVPAGENEESIPAEENAGREDAAGAAPAGVQDEHEAAETAAESEEAAPTEAEPNEAPEN